MSCATRIAKPNLRLNLRDAGHKQHQTLYEKDSSGGGGSLSPNLQPATPPTFPNNNKEPTATKVADKYLLLNRLEGSTLRHCIHIQSQKEFVCKVIIFKIIMLIVILLTLFRTGRLTVNP